MAPLITLEGVTLGERHRHLNGLVSRALQRGQSCQDATSILESTPLDRLFNIDLASASRNLDYVLTTLTDEDMLYVSRALKNTWLFESQYAHIINPEYLEGTLYPKMKTTAVNKMKHRIALNLRNEDRCAQFFEYYCSKNFDLAMKFLWHCSNEFILSKVPDLLEKLTAKHLKVLSEKCPEVTKIYYDSFKTNEAVLRMYLNNEREYNMNLKYVLKLNADIYLDIIEKYFTVSTFEPLSPETTKYIMKNCKDKFDSKQELYTAWLLDMKTLAKYLTKEEIKEVILKFARAEFLNNWFTYKKVEPLIKSLPVKERTEFKKLVFVDKSVGEKVKEWPYAPPSRPELTSSDVDVFQDIDHSPREYERLEQSDMMYCCGFARSCKMKRSNCIICPQKTLLDKLFDIYRFASFEKTLFELRRKITVESQQNRQYMMLVLVSKTGGRPENVDVLLKLLVERHENEPVNLRATVIRSLVKRSNAWRLPKETWNLFLKFGRDLGLDGKPPAAACVEGIHAVVLRTLLEGRVCETAIWNAFIKHFSDFTDYSLTVAEKCVLTAKIPELLLSDVQADPSQAVGRLDQLLGFLETYKIPADKCPGVISAVATTANRNANAKTLLHRLFNGRIARKELFKENFAIIQTDASYLNALKHCKEILESGKEFEALVEAGDLKHERFLRALALYFSEKNGLAEQYFAILVKRVNESPRKNLARPLALLSGNKLVPLLQELDFSPKDSDAKRFSATLRANAHLSRPYIDLNAFGLQSFGAKAISNRVLTCSAVTIDSNIEKLLNWNRTQRLAFVLSLRIEKEYETLVTIALRRPQLALKMALWHTRHNKLDKRVWDVIIPLIAKSDVYLKVNDRLRKALRRQVDAVPLERKADYCVVVFEQLQKISLNESMPMLCHLEIILPDVDEGYMEGVIKRYLKNEFTEDKFSLKDYAFKMSTKLYFRIIGKYLLICKNEETQKDRLKNIGGPFFDRLESIWKNLEDKYSRELKKILFDFILSLKFTKVFLDPQYVSCLPVFELVTTRLQKFLPIELNFDKYVHLHLTMLYFKALRQSVKNNPEIFKNLSKNMSEALEIVGVIFGKYIAHEISQLKAKYFDSVINLYKSDLVEYVNTYFPIFYNRTRSEFLAAIIKGVLESDSKAHLVAEYLYNSVHYNFADKIEEKVLNNLKECETPDVKFFLYADIYCD